METLPGEIRNHILFELTVNDIASCLCASNIFHVLTTNQIRIYHEALRGPKYLLKSNLFESFDLIPMECWQKLKLRWYFYKSCLKSHFESVQWLYKLNQIFQQFDFNETYYSFRYDTEREDPDCLDTDGYYGQDSNLITSIFSVACNNLNIAKWLYNFDTVAKIDFGTWDNSYLLSNACENGHLDMVKWLHSICIEKSISINYQKLFNNCYNDKSLEVMKWLYSLEEFVIDMHDTSCFYRACILNQTKIVEYLYSISNGCVNIHYDDELYFRESCRHGNLEMVKWLLNISVLTGNKIDIHINKDEAFLNACKSGNLELVKFLVLLDGKINVHTQKKKAFRICCEIGHLQILQYLYSVSLFDIREKDELLFRLSCRNGHLEIVKWLLSLNTKTQSINIRARNDYCFRMACLNDHLEMAKFLFDQVQGKINIRSFNNDELFRTNCKSDNCCMAEWLTFICPSYTIKFYGDTKTSLRSASINGEEINCYWLHHN